MPAQKLIHAEPNTSLCIVSMLADGTHYDATWFSVLPPGIRVLSKFIFGFQTSSLPSSVYESPHEDVDSTRVGSPSPGSQPKEAWSPISEGVAEMNEALAAPLPVDSQEVRFVIWLATVVIVLGSFITQTSVIVWFLSILLFWNFVKLRLGKSTGCHFWLSLQDYSISGQFHWSCCTCSFFMVLTSYWLPICPSISPFIDFAFHNVWNQHPIWVLSAVITVNTVSISC